MALFAYEQALWLAEEKQQLEVEPATATTSIASANAGNIAHEDAAIMPEVEVSEEEVLQQVSTSLFSLPSPPPYFLAPYWCCCRSTRLYPLSFP